MHTQTVYATIHAHIHTHTHTHTHIHTLFLSFTFLSSLLPNLRQSVQSCKKGIVPHWLVQKYVFLVSLARLSWGRERERERERDTSLFLSLSLPRESLASKTNVFQSSRLFFLSCCLRRHFRGSWELLWSQPKLNIRARLSSKLVLTVNMYKVGSL